MPYKKTLENLIKRIVVERTAKTAPKRVTVSWPVYDYREILSAINSLLDLRISQGPKVREFEKEFAKYVGIKYAVAVNSGSSANLLALLALMEVGDLKRGDEVIVPAATFATVAMPVVQLGLIPVFVDVKEDSYNIDPAQIKKALSKRTRVIMPVHSLGNPAEIPEIMRIAKREEILVLEDCCEAHGASINGRKVGSFGDLATYSFFVAHNITTGEGGMVLTNNKKYYDILTSIREFGRLPMDKLAITRFVKDPVLGSYDARQFYQRLGFNMRLTDIAASLGIEQLKKLDKLNADRIKIIEAYERGLMRYSSYLQLPEVRHGTFHSFYGYPILIRKDAPFKRAELMKFLEDRGVEVRAFFGGCLPDHPAFRKVKKKIIGELPVSRWIRDNAIFIGCHPAISREQIKQVVQAFDGFFKNLPK